METNHRLTFTCKWLLLCEYNDGAKKHNHIDGMHLVWSQVGGATWNVHIELGDAPKGRV